MALMLAGVRVGAPQPPGGGEGELGGGGEGGGDGGGGEGELGGGGGAAIAAARSSRGMTSPLTGSVTYRCQAASKATRCLSWQVVCICQASALDCDQQHARAAGQLRRLGFVLLGAS